MIDKLFREHPASVGESYTEHFRQAMGFSGTLFGAAFACFIHGLIPGLCKTKGSQAICQLHERMVTHRAEQTPRRREANRAALRQDAA